MTTAESVITDEMRAAIGVEGPPAVMEVEKTNCRMFARSVGHTDPIFYDEAAAKARGYRSIVAPPGFLGTPIFDEKHYAPQAWQLLHNHGVEDNPGYGLVVHPPVGKQLIAIGEAVFGYNGLGWRFSGAVCGVILVLLIVRIGRG